MYGNGTYKDVIKLIAETTGVTVSEKDIENYILNEREKVRTLEGFYRVDNNIYKTASYRGQVEGLLRELLDWIMQDSHFSSDYEIDTLDLAEWLETGAYQEFLDEKGITKEEMQEAIFQNEYKYITLG